ncbi:leucine-rich repeat extensin-like protein 1 [Dendrobium catenatum]|uniref:leucine-rich repeat extensin-like protein 1 n=1 Tax=Dendrobium catenatum TaxID=906689 RepID=UPI0010A060E3|nr:leucine-rich repeat extensin-like protein 1 [Dendrobium catenatum]
MPPASALAPRCPTPCLGSPEVYLKFSLFCRAYRHKLPPPSVGRLWSPGFALFPSPLDLRALPPSLARLSAPGPGGAGSPWRSSYPRRWLASGLLGPFPPFFFLAPCVLVPGFPPPLFRLRPLCAPGISVAFSHPRWPSSASLDPAVFPWPPGPPCVPLLGCHSFLVLLIVFLFAPCFCCPLPWLCWPSEPLSLVCSPASASSPHRLWSDGLTPLAFPPAPSLCCLPFGPPSPSSFPYPPATFPTNDTPPFFVPPPHPNPPCPFLPLAAFWHSSALSVSAAQFSRLCSCGWAYLSVPLGSLPFPTPVPPLRPSAFFPLLPAPLGLLPPVSTPASWRRHFAPGSLCAFLSRPRDSSPLLLLTRPTSPLGPVA